MGRGNSGIGTGKGTRRGVFKPYGNGSPTYEPATPPKTLYSKSQVNDLTKDYTPEMFIGDPNTWTGTVADAKFMAETTMPDSLEIAGYTFKPLGGVIADHVATGQLKNNTVVMLDYQCTEKVGNEYPVLQIGVRIRKFRGKVQTEIIRDHYQYGTKFW